MTFPPFFNALAPRQTTGTSLGGSTATQRLLFANALRQQQQQQSMLFSPSMANTISRLLPTATAVSEPRSATPDPLPEETIEYDEYDHDQDDTEADSAEDQEVRDGPSHCRHHQEQQHESIAAAAAAATTSTTTTTSTSTSTISDDEDNAALMLLGLSKIVSKEISTDARCMVPRKGHEKLRDNPSTAVQHVASVPKSIEIDTRHWEGSDSCRSSRASPTKNNTQGLSPVVVVSLNGNHSSLASLSPPRIINQPRYRTVSLAGDEILPGRNSGNGNNTKAVHELSPLLLPLSSPRATTEEFNNSKPSFFLRESPPPKVDHKRRFRYTTTNWEEQQQQQRVIEAFRNDSRALEEAVAAAAVASHIITPIPRQPRPVVSFATAAEKRAASAAAAIAASKTRVVVTHMGPTTEMVPDAAGGSEGHSPLELPPLLPTPKTKANVQETTEGNIYVKPPPQLIAPTKQQLISYNEDIEATIATRQKNANTVAAANKRRNQNQPPASRSCAKVSRHSAAAAKSKASSKNKNQPVHGPRSKKKNTTAATKKPQRQRQSGKKFSWKAYPELESFLIVNREEYLSFSARNYTIEQRDYNNRLTSRLLEHANTSGYSTLFESCAFSAVRDRIRSYYKSYVQSFKRRKERQQQQERLKQLEMDCSN